MIPLSLLPLLDDPDSLEDELVEEDSSESDWFLRLCFICNVEHAYEVLSCQIVFFIQRLSVFQCVHTFVIDILTM